MVSREPTSVIMVHARYQGVVSREPASVVMVHVGYCFMICNYLVSMICSAARLLASFIFSVCTWPYKITITLKTVSFTKLHLHKYKGEF